MLPDDPALGSPEDWQVLSNSTYFGIDDTIDPADFRQ